MPPLTVSEGRGEGLDGCRGKAPRGRLSERGERRAAVRAGRLLWPVLAGAASCRSLLPREGEASEGTPPPSPLAHSPRRRAGLSLGLLYGAPSLPSLPPSSLPRLSQACCCVLDEVGKLGAEAPRRGRSPAKSRCSPWAARAASGAGWTEEGRRSAGASPPLCLPPGEAWRVFANSGRHEVGDRPRLGRGCGWWSSHGNEACLR